MEAAAGARPHARRIAVKPPYLFQRTAATASLVFVRRVASTGVSAKKAAIERKPISDWKLGPDIRVGNLLQDVWKCAFPAVHDQVDHHAFRHVTDEVDGLNDLLGDRRCRRHYLTCQFPHWSRNTAVREHMKIAHNGARQIWVLVAVSQIDEIGNDAGVQAKERHQGRVCPERVGEFFAQMIEVAMPALQGKEVARELADEADCTVDVHEKRSALEIEILDLRERVKPPTMLIARNALGFDSGDNLFDA